MVIDAHDHFFICMAHPVDDVLNIDPGVAAGGAERMAQIMKANLFALSSLQNDMEHSEHGAGPDWFILLDGRGEQPPGLCRLSVFPEHLHHGRRQHQFADGRFCLWRCML